MSDLFDELFDAWAESVRGDARLLLESVAYKKVESPIELRLLTALAFMRPENTGNYDMPLNIDGKFSVRPQHPEGPYRIDLAVFAMGDRIKIAVECDGHQFHEKTKEQAAHDKARDRYLTTRGWRVMRFTGSEIWQDAAGCAQQVADLIDAEVCAIWDAQQVAA